MSDLYQVWSRSKSWINILNGGALLKEKRGQNDYLYHLIKSPGIIEPGLFIFYII
jgi:hypothetical protein